MRANGLYLDTGNGKGEERRDSSEGRGRIVPIWLNTNLNESEKLKEETMFLADSSPRYGEQKEGWEEMNFVSVMRDCPSEMPSGRLEL